jgi:GNAT superfamily N-acetyltransferase
VTSGPPDLIVRVAGADDIGAITALYALWDPDTDLDTAFQERLAEWLDAEGDRRTTWLAQLGAAPVGLASLFEYRRMPRPGRLDSRWGYVGNMFVDTAHRGRGIGAALLDAIVATAEERGYVRLVLSPTERAVPFYRRAGFVVPDDAAGGHALLVRVTS